jgi:hypothetical protein
VITAMFFDPTALCYWSGFRRTTPTALMLPKLSVFVAITETTSSVDIFDGAV